MSATFVWTIGDLLSLVFFALLGLIFGVDAVVKYFRQKFCKHLKYYQTRECHAICEHCGKDLGSVAWLEYQKEKSK